MKIHPEYLRKSQAERELEEGNLEEIGMLMNENQRLLAQIGVSCEKIDQYISIAEDNRALGSKITGAGRGGNFLVLAQNWEQACELKKLYENIGLRVFL